MKNLLAVTAAGVMALGASAFAGSATNAVDVEWDSSTTGTVATSVLSLGAVSSIDSITLDLAHTWGGDFDITVQAPDGQIFDLMMDEVNQAASGNFDMGLVGFNGTLSNVDAYTFVASGGLTTWDSTSGVAPGDTYNANSWGVGSWAAGDWTLTVIDDTSGDPGAVGDFTINFTALPGPAGLALLGLAGLSRRRRR